MKLVVGLGNPGKKYAATRHNLGFQVVNELAARHPIDKEESRFDAIVGHCRISGQKILLVKPLTYMNLSGKSIWPLVRFYKVPLEDIMVVYDDMDIPPGTLRIRAAGGNGGHKGMGSIIASLGSNDIARIRIGVGRPDGDVTDWVLSVPSTAEQMEINYSVKQAALAVETWIDAGIATAMNQFNKQV